jgi:hypothetical protein
MAIKLLLEITDSNGVITKKIYLKGGLRKIANEFPEYEYHVLRAIYLKCNNIENRKTHRSTLALYEKMKIYEYDSLSDELKQELFLYS